jgi:hypothetical protein
LKLLPNIPIPRAKGLGLGREVVGGLKGEAEGTSDWCDDRDLSNSRSVGFGPAVNRLTGRLQGVSGMLLLKVELVSSALRFFLEISPVDMKAAGKGLTSL